MRWMTIMLAAALGCAGAETKPSHRGHEQEVDPEKAEQLMQQAEKKMEANEFGEARALLRDAYRYSDSEIRHRIGLENDELDEAQAAHLATQLAAYIKAGKCADALGGAAKVIAETQETEVPALIAQKSGDGLKKCVASVIEAGELPRARELLASPASKKALDPQRHAALTKQLEAAVMGALDERIGESMTARNWPDVVAKLHQAVKEGAAGAEHREKVLAKVRKGIAEDVEKIVGEAFGESKGASEALAKVDTLLAAGFWKPRPIASDGAVDAETARLQKLLEPKTETKQPTTKPGDEPTQLIPEKLDKLRRELAFWVGCDAIKCKPIDSAQMWTYGNTPLHPALAPREQASQKLATGRQVWRIAEGGTFSLVALKDPGALADLKARAHAGVGWVPTSALKATDTSEMLPPGDSLIGTRVWGPLHEGATDLEIGKVIGIEGANVQVQRLSDQNVMSVPRARLYFGLTKKGTKVMAMCGNTSMSQAVIDKVIEPKHESLGDARAIIRCLDDKGQPASKTREDPLGALRTKREWLPPQK